MKKLFFVIILTISHLAKIDAQQKFKSLDELLTFAETKNISIKSNNIRLLQAKKTLLASKLAIADPQANINSSFTDNTRLPVNIIPAQLFGGSQGEFREVQFGVQYNTNSTQNIDIKLLNLEGWQNFKLSEINYIFSSDEYLHKINLQYLDHDTYTDIITFDNSEEEKLIEGDIFVSIDRVKENARDFNSPFEQELRRVLVHGVLHLCGYFDKSVEDEKLMRMKEEFYLNLFE